MTFFVIGSPLLSIAAPDTLVYYSYGNNNHKKYEIAVGYGRITTDEAFDGGIVYNEYGPEFLIKNYTGLFMRVAVEG